MELHKIVKEWLEKNGFDGLCDPSIECGCGIDDFMPCGEPGIHCEAGHQVEAPHDSGVDYFIWPGKAQPEDSPDLCKCEEPDNDMVPFGNHCLACGKNIYR